MWRCPKQAVGFLAWRAPREKTEYLPSLPRRRVVAALGVGIAAGLAQRAVEWRERRRQHPLALRPPGAVTEEKFVDLCLRCGECWRACPTGGLQPALGEAGVAGLFTPVLVPLVGWCQADCNLCGQVCPTQAIRALTVEEKRIYKIGLSSIDQTRCLAWSQRQDCLVCQEVCPYSAVQVVMDRGVGCPQVVEEDCVGCGQCEFHCAATPLKAIGPRAVSPRPGVGEKRAEVAAVRGFPGLGPNRPPSGG